MTLQRNMGVPPHGINSRVLRGNFMEHFSTIELRKVWKSHIIEIKTQGSIERALMLKTSFSPLIFPSLKLKTALKWRRVKVKRCTIVHDRIYSAIYPREQFPIMSLKSSTYVVS